MDEELTAVRWPDIRDRIFGRIDPIAEGGAEYRENHEDNRNVDVYRGEGRSHRHEGTARQLPDGRPDEVVTADRFVLAAGGRPVIPDVPGLAETATTPPTRSCGSTHCRSGSSSSAGGYIAAEFAHVFASFGVAVTMVNRSGALLRQEDADVSARFTELASQRFDVRLERKTVRARRTDNGSRWISKARRAPRPSRPT
ncbi:FAD-dependent oxidoreductase [Amycolatopsis halotolerans]|uniref:FAD-dependent oxidoreductase n=1 Tax=Amycolatopsis halotolerans TaxID=330083 RepID=UPI00360E12DC